MADRAARGGRLTRSADFDRVLRRGRSWGGRDLVLHAFPRPDEAAGPSRDGPDARVGLSVSRRVGGAVQRNRVKRLLREAVRAAAAELPDGVDLVLVARPGLGEVAAREGLAGVGAALGPLLDRARHGLSTDGTAGSGSG